MLLVSAQRIRCVYIFTISAYMMRVHLYSPCPLTRHRLHSYVRCHWTGSLQCSVSPRELFEVWRNLWSRSADGDGLRPLRDGVCQWIALM